MGGLQDPNLLALVFLYYVVGQDPPDSHSSNFLLNTLSNPSTPALYILLYPSRPQMMPVHLLDGGVGHPRFIHDSTTLVGIGI